MRRRPGWWRVVVPFASVIPFACSSDVPALAGGEEPDGSPGGTVTTLHLRVEAPRPHRVDLVVLVDDRASMVEEQGVLPERLREIVLELVSPWDADGDTRPDHCPVDELHLAVVSPDLGSGGRADAGCADPEAGHGGCFLHDPSPAVDGCAASYPPFLSGAPETDAPEDLARDFSCIGTLGTAGCRFGQQFAAMVRALRDETEAGECNAGFLQPDSLLALLWITDEDDCSVSPDHPEFFDPAADLGPLELRCTNHPELLVPVEDVVAALEDLNPDDPSRLVLGMVVGVPPLAPACLGSGERLEGCLAVPAMTPTIDPEDPSRLLPSCHTELGDARPPVRFIRLAQAFGSRAVVTSICGDSWLGALSVREVLFEPLPAVCLPRDVPVDPATCLPACILVETKRDAGPCEEDPSCPATRCPPATAADLPLPPPCADPETGAECRPLKRDLGTIDGSDGVPRRQCLLRPATRTPGPEGICGAPTDRGWLFYPSDFSPERCALIVADDQDGCDWGLFEDGAVGDVLCLDLPCPEARRCGSLARFEAMCCREGDACTVDSDGGPTCSPAPAP